MSHDRETCTCGSMSHKDADCPQRCKYCGIGGNKHKSDCTDSQWPVGVQAVYLSTLSKQVKPITCLNDAVNHPKHYNSNPSGVECIEVIRHMTFNVGNAVKYCWRAGLKVVSNPNAYGSEHLAQVAQKLAKIEDLKKAIWYLQDEVTLLEGTKKPAKSVYYEIDAKMRPCNAIGTRACGEISFDLSGVHTFCCIYPNCSARKK